MQTRYGLVGDGRLARHLTHYFELSSIPHRRWFRRSPDPLNSLKDCPVLLLAISDRAIEPFAQALQDHPDPLMRDKTLVHFSGSVSSPLARGFHPLMTFAEDLYPRSAYESIPFVGEDGFKEIFPELPNPFFRINPEQKALYHAFCVMSGNFMSFLWSHVFEALPEKLGIPSSAAIPYLRQVTENLARNHENPRRTWSGPIVRRDHETIAKNLKALSGDPYRKVYEVFVETITGENAS